MLALLTYDKGDIRIFGKQMKADSYDLKQQIGVVPQNVAVFHELSVEDNINYFCGLYVSDKAKRKTLVDDDDATANFLNLFHIMRGIHNGCPLRIQAPYALQYRITALWIDCDRRLIHENELWLMCNSTGDIQPSQ